jgi:imidazolonepropionase-like amidohydrolase
MFRHLIVGLAILVAPLAAEVKVFKGFTLIDGSGGAPAPASAMIVDNGRISWIGPTAKLNAPAGAETVDLRGKFVMPGIINLHGHLGNVVDLTQDRKYYTRENVQKDLNTYASYGVTTVLSMGTDQDLIFRIRDEQRATGRPKMTRVYTAGQGFAFKGGYGGLPGVTYSLEGTSEVEKDVAELAKKKVDIVKMWVDDHLGHMKKMPFEISKAIIDSAHNHGLPAAAHIFYLDDAKKLAAAGVNGFAHSVRDKPVDQELIDIMKQHGTWLAAATLTREASTFVYAKPPKFLNDPFFTRSVSPKVVATLKSADYQKEIAADPDFPKLPGILEMAKKNLKRLSDAGVKYGFGTDAGPPGRFPGFFEQWEMELMVEAGLTPAKVIQAATKSAAEFLAAKDLGTLEPGKWADMIILNADPLKDIRNTHKIHSVYIAGNPVTGGK